MGIRWDLCVICGVLIVAAISLFEWMYKKGN